MPKLGQWLYQQEQAWRELQIADAYPACRELAAAVLDCQSSDIPARLSHELTPSELDWLTRAAARHTAGEPIGLIFGQVRLFERNWFVANQSLIPRAESYPLITMAKRTLKQSPPIQQLIEIGTGSGWLLVQLLAELEPSQLNKLQLIGGSDNQPSVLETARHNANRQLSKALADKIHWRTGDLSAPWSELKNSRHNLILANLPYLSQRQYDSLDSSVKAYEPAGALIGGATGNELYLELIEQLLQLPVANDLILETNTANLATLRESLPQHFPQQIEIVEAESDANSQTECVWLRLL